MAWYDFIAPVPNLVGRAVNAAGNGNFSWKGLGLDLAGTNPAGTLTRTIGGFGKPKEGGTPQGPTFTPSTTVTNSTPVGPTTSATTSVLSDRQRAENIVGPLNDVGYGSAYNDYVSTLQGNANASRGQLNAQLGQLRGLYNYDREDPNAVTIRDWAIAELGAQKAGAQGAISNSYGAGVAANRATADQIRQSGAANSDAIRQLYADAASRSQDSNEALGSLYGQSLGLGDSVGAAGGAASDYVAALDQASAREAAYASNKADTNAQFATSYADALQGQEAAQQGSLQRAALAMNANIASEYAQREAARQASEYDAYRSAAQGLIGDYNSNQNAFAQQIADAQLQGRLAEVERAGARDQTISDIATRFAYDRYEKEAAGFGTSTPAGLLTNLDALSNYGTVENLQWAGTDGLTQSADIDGSQVRALVQNAVNAAVSDTTVAQDLAGNIQANLDGLPAYAQKYIAEANKKSPGTFPTNPQTIASYYGG